MSKRTIEVSVAPDGSISIEAVAFQGSDCEAATRFLEEALGVVSSKAKKPEYHQRSRRSNQQRVGS
jgi:hypothetical protein